MGHCPVGKWIIFQVPVLLWNSAHCFWDFSALSFIHSSFFMSFPVPVTEKIPKAWLCHHHPSLYQECFLLNILGSEVFRCSRRPFEGHSTSTALQVWKISQLWANPQLFHIFFHHFMMGFTYLWPWLLFLFSWNCVSLVGKLQRCC